MDIEEKVKVFKCLSGKIDVLLKIMNDIADDVVSMNDLEQIQYFVDNTPNIDISENEYVRRD